MHTQRRTSKTTRVRSPLTVFLLILLLTACTPSRTPTALARGLSDAVSGKADAGGYELYYTCAGEGSPTVIIEAGGGSNSADWELLMVYYRGYTRICAYDRANLGNSDPAPRPRTFDDMTRDLHTLLQNLPIEGPYVLVGHSMGGMLVRLYASQYPEDAVGLVLVDSAHPDMGSRLLAALPPESAGGDKTFKSWREYARWLSTSNGQVSVDAEGVDIQISNEQVREVKSLGDLPLAVVSRSPSNPILVSGMPALPEEINANLIQQWQDMQAELEELSSNSTRFTAEHAGHGVMVEEPMLVVSAIRHVVDEYRAQTGIVLPPAPEQTDAASHAPVMLGITERNEWQNGDLVIYKDISFKDPAGDAITVINTVISAPVTSVISDDIIRSSPAEQEQGAILTTRVRCRREYQVVIEFRVLDAAGNTSAPETAIFSCLAPRPYLNPIVIGGVVLVLFLAGFGIWLLLHQLRRRRAAVIYNEKLAQCSNKAFRKEKQATST